MRSFIRVHFINGTSVDGKTEDITEEQLNAAKIHMAELVSADDNWQCNLERASDNSWVLCPGRHVLAIEFVKVDEEE